MAIAHERMLDPEQRLADMDERGIDIQVLSSSTVMQYTAWAEPPLQLELEARVNDAIAALCLKHPDRFVGSFTLPVRDIDLAVGETQRAVQELGLRRHQPARGRRRRVSRREAIPPALGGVPRSRRRRLCPSGRRP